VTPAPKLEDRSTPLHTKRTFGKIIRELRLEKTQYSLRKLAETVGISPAYLSRLESDRDPPPSEEIVIKIARALATDSDELLSHANKVSPDLVKIIRNHPKSVPAFLRLAKEKNFSEQDWKRIREYVESKTFRKKGI
jgi:transcriptional regulator with XRE-family HTH domain